MTSTRRRDCLVILGILVFAVLVHIGRLGSSVNGVQLETDSSMYCSIAAAWGSPETFLGDFSFGLTSNFAPHVTPLVKLVHWLAGNVTGGNYGLAYLELTGACLFLFYTGFYLLGRLFFTSVWKAVLFALLMGQCYWIPWGTYWGAGYWDYTPRTFFDGFYALFLCASFLVLKKPRWWPVFFLLLSLTVYVHPISALPAAAGLWLCFAAAKEKGTSLGRHLGTLFVSGLCFLIGIVPYAMVYLRSAGVSLGPDEVAYMNHILRTRFNIEYAEYWAGMVRFYKQYTFLPVLPASLVATWYLATRGSLKEKLFCRHIWLLTAGVYVVIALFLADQIISASLGRVHLEFDLVRVHRFLPFMGITLILLGLNLWLTRLKETRAKGLKLWTGRVVAFSFCLGFFLGGQQDLARQSFAWYWNRADESRYEQAYADDLARSEMIEAVKTLTAPGERIFFSREDQSLRYNARRPITWCWKDACYLYYAKNLDALREWERVLNALKESDTAYVDAGLSTDPDWLLTDRPQDRALLMEKAGPVVWENSRYLLVRCDRTKR